LFNIDDNGKIIISDNNNDDKNEIDDVSDVKPKMNLFTDILNNISNGESKLSWDEMEKSYNPYVINRCLVRNDAFVNIACKLNIFASKIEDKQHYDILFDYIKPKKYRYLKYLSQNEFEKDIVKISKFFKINKYHIEEYLKLMDKNDIKGIIKKIDSLTKSPTKKILKR